MFPASSHDLLTRLGFPVAGLLDDVTVAHPELPFRARLVRLEGSSQYYSGSRFVVGLRPDHKLGHAADNAPELRDHRVDTAKPRWERSLFAWWNRAVFRMQEFTAAKAAKEAQAETFRRMAAEQIERSCGVTLGLFARVFSYGQKDTGEIGRINLTTYPNLHHPEGWRDLPTDDQLAKCARVLKVLREEGFLP